MARIVLFTDQPILAKGFTAVLSATAGFEVAAVCRGLRQMLDALALTQPQLALIDLNSEITFQTLAELRAVSPNTRFVLWVYNISPELAYYTVRLGVRGILRKTMKVELAIQCLCKVLDGESCFHDAFSPTSYGLRAVSLTRRESQILELISAGLRNHELAQALSVSEGTVKVYVSRLCHKVRAKDRYEVALCGLRNSISKQPGLAGCQQQNTAAAAGGNTG